MKVVKSSVILALMVAALILLLPGQCVYADAAPFFIGGVNITPYEETNIVLSKEDLTITFGKNVGPRNSVARVEAKFVLVNTGDKVSLRVGFPFGLASRPGFDNTSSLESLKAKVKVDGKEITPSFIEPGKAGQYGPLMYFDITFEKSESKNVEVSYEAEPVGGHFLYVLTTGAYWKGPIGTLNMTFKFPYETISPNVLSVTPGGYKVKGNEIVYQLTNYEPKQDIEIEFLPYDFYEKINPLRLKAEKSNSSNDWFNYALSLFPQNPLRSLEEFVGWYRTNAFKDYVGSVLQKVVGLQEKNSPEYVVLQEIYEAHYSAPASFLEGYDAVTRLDQNYAYLPQNAINLLENNVDSIKTSIEGKVFGYFLEYVVMTDLRQNNPQKALSDFNKLLAIAEKYFDKDDYNEVSAELDIAITYSLGDGLVKRVSPAYTECFVPSVSIKGRTVSVHYDLPYEMAQGLETFDTKNDPNFGKAYQLSANFEKVPPYNYVFSISFPDSLTEEDFDKMKDELQNGALNEYFDGNTYNLLSVYLPDIIGNLTLKNGKLEAIKTSIDTEEKSKNALASLREQIINVEDYQKHFENTVFDRVFAQKVIAYLSSNKAYFDNLPKDSNIKFAAVQNATKSSISKTRLTVVLCAAVGALLVYAALVMSRRTKALSTQK